MIVLKKARKLHDRVAWEGFQISIENARGTVRSGTDSHGEWSTAMQYDYGYFRGTLGMDGDQLDVYVGPNLHDAKRVYAINQKDPVTGAPDEQKIFIGFASADDAKRAYLAQYDDPGYYGSMTEMSIREFKETAKTMKGKPLTKLTMKSYPHDDAIVLLKGKWLYSYRGQWHSLHPVPGFGVDLQLTKAQKYYSSDEQKARGMIWRTIRGARVLLQGTKDGGYVVVGGAGGRMNHMRVDKFVNRQENKDETEEGIGKEQIEGEGKAQKREKSGEEKRKERAQRKATEKVTKQYQRRISDIVENVQKLVDDEEMAAIREAAEAKAKAKFGEGEPGEGKGGKGNVENFIQKEVEKQTDRVRAKKVAELEKRAMEKLMGEFMGDAVSDKASVPRTDDEMMDPTVAKEILEAKKRYRDVKKQIKKAGDAERVAIIPIDKVFADPAIGGEDSINEEVARNIETAKNIDFYDRINANYEKVKKHIDNGVSRGLNSVLGDVYGTDAVFTDDLARELGVEVLAQGLAAKIRRDGMGEEVKRALQKFSDQVREATVDKAMARADDSMSLKDQILSLAEDLGEDAPAVLSKAQAQGMAIRHYVKAQEELGNAAGSLRAMAHLLSAMEGKISDTLTIDMGNDETAARERMKRAGVKPDQYTFVRDEKNRIVAKINKNDLVKVIQEDGETKRQRQNLNKIKRHELNTGELATGMDPKNKWGFNPKTKQIEKKLADAQESGYRFAKEKGRVLLDFQAGLGKTFITANLIADALSGGAKNILVAVPATLKNQTSGEYVKFLEDQLKGQIKKAPDTWSPAKRRAYYEEQGVHVVSHDALLNDKDALLGKKWDAVFVDEIHQMVSDSEDELKGSGRYKVAEQLSKQVERFVGMTGTPIKNSKTEMWRVAKLVEPDNKLGSLNKFNKKYKNINQSVSAFMDSEAEGFRKAIAPFSYSQGYELPVEKRKATKRVDVSGEQRKKMKEIYAQYGEEQEKIDPRTGKKGVGAASRRDQRLWRNTHLTGGRDNPKFQSIVNSIRNEQSENARGLLFFSQGTATMGAKQYAKQLDEEFGAGAAMVITSKTTKKQLEEYKQRINNPGPGEKLRFLVGTDTLSTGHNIQGAEFVYHVDIPVTPAQAEQQDARAYRNGQVHNVDVRSFESSDPNDVNKKYLLNRKEKEFELLGNPAEVSGADEGGFGAVLAGIDRDLNMSKEGA